MDELIYKNVEDNGNEINVSKMRRADSFHQRAAELRAEGEDVCNRYVQEIIKEELVRLDLWWLDVLGLSSR